jgi:2-(1,2-epoxy-1,2-dihydrophenyl)acetyl-CoA isomerase
MSTPPVLVEHEGAIATIAFNRPEHLNALDLPSAQAFAAACAALAGNPAVRVVVLRGEGRCFGAGGDLQGFVKGGWPLPRPPARRPRPTPMGWPTWAASSRPCTRA